jgi:response regulator RpfG family c-di-GMP phosphodiesterase
MSKSFNDSVLLVDDQKIITGLLAAKVTEIRSDSEIERASSFDEANLLLIDRTKRHEPFSSVVTDYVLDHKGGTALALVKAAAEQGSRVAVISGDASTTVVHKCVAAGASAFIEKTMDEHQLRLCLELFFGGVNFVPTPPYQPGGRVTEDKDLIMLYYLANNFKYEQIALLTGVDAPLARQRGGRVTELFAKKHGVVLVTGDGKKEKMAADMRVFGYHVLPEHLEGKVKT